MSVIINLGQKTFVPAHRIICVRAATADEATQFRDIRSVVEMEDGKVLYSIRNAAILAQRMGYVPPTRKVKKKKEALT